MAVFVSFNFEDRRLAEWVQYFLSESGLEPYLAGEPESKSLAEHIKAKIKESEALLSIITSKKSAWVQNEIALAYGFGVPVYAVAEKGLELEGIVGLVTVSIEFDPNDREQLRRG
jgi:hypothetical protein